MNFLLPAGTLLLADAATVVAVVYGQTNACTQSLPGAAASGQFSADCPSTLHPRNSVQPSLVQTAVIRDVAQGTVPQRQNIQGNIPFNLMKSETLVRVIQGVDYLETVTRRERRGSSHGVSIRVARGPYYRPSTFRSLPIEGEETVHTDTSLLGITTKHIYFAGDRKAWSSTRAKPTRPSPSAPPPTPWDDDGESVKLTFGTLPAGVAEGTTKETVISITDDGDPAVTVSFGSATCTVLESDDAVTTDVTENTENCGLELRPGIASASSPDTPRSCLRGLPGGGDVKEIYDTHGRGRLPRPRLSKRI